jgi:hypothetical protein
MAYAGCQLAPWPAPAPDGQPSGHYLPRRGPKSYGVFCSPDSWFCQPELPAGAPTTPIAHIASTCVATSRPPERTPATCQDPVGRRASLQSPANDARVPTGQGSRHRLRPDQRNGPTLPRSAARWRQFVRPRPEGLFSRSCSVAPRKIDHHLALTAGSYPKDLPPVVPAVRPVTHGPREQIRNSFIRNS